MSAERADEALVRGGFAPSLEAARILVMEGRVYQNEERLDKPSDLLRPEAKLMVRERTMYVSRGAQKLKRALEAFHIDVSDLVCIDVGSSTGGFTDVLLQSGAARVYSVDVGYGLLDWKLRKNERVTVMERTNARFLKKDMFPDAPVFGATDVSFISLKAILPAALGVLSSGRMPRFVALIKPQFEAPKAQVGAKGVVRAPETHRAVIRDIVDFVEATDFRASALDHSPITGPEGNIEFLLDIRPKALELPVLDQNEIDRVVAAAHDKFVNLAD